MASQDTSVDASGVPERDGPDFREYLDIVVDNRHLIFAIVIIFALFGLAYSFFSTPIFESNMLLQVEDNSPVDKGSLGDVSALFDVKPIATGEIEILRSRLVLGRAIKNLGLDIDVSPRYMPLIGKLSARFSTAGQPSSLSGLLGYSFGGETLRISSFEMPPVLQGQPFIIAALPDGHFSLRKVDGDTKVVGKVGVPLSFSTSGVSVSITVDAMDARPGASFFVTRSPTEVTLNGLQQALKIVERGKESGIIGATLEDTDPNRAAQILNEIGTAYVRQNVERKSAEAEHTLSYLRNQLPELRKQLDTSEEKYNRMRSRLGAVDISSEGKLILEQSVALQTQLSTLQQQRQEVLAKFTANHPAAQAVDRQIAIVHAQIDGVQKQITRLPHTEQEVLRLTRDVSVENDLYVGVLNSVQQLKVVTAGKVGNVRVVDTAIVPLKPIKPNKVLICLISIFAGIFIALSAAVAKHVLFDGVADASLIESATGLSVLATIPHSINLANSGSPVVLAEAFPGDMAIESLRSLRTALQFALLGGKNGVIAITGPTPGVGKSFVSINLASVMASSGRRVLLIDGDMRRGSLNDYFGLTRKQGLAELLIDKISLKEAIKTGVNPHLDFIPTGAAPPNPAELLLQPRFRSFLDQCRENYDYIIIDTPPILAVTDSAVESLQSDATILVVRAESTSMGEVQESVRRLRQAEAPLKGILLNDVPTNKRRYGYGSKYGKYRYSYETYGSDMSKGA